MRISEADDAVGPSPSPGRESRINGSGSRSKLSTSSVSRGKPVPQPALKFCPTMVVFDEHIEKPVGGT